MADQYDWWRGACNAVADKALEAYFGAYPIHEGEPESGFYETRSKNKETGQEIRGVCALWRDQSGKLWGQLGKDFNIPEVKIRERWHFYAKRPIFHPTYKFVLDNDGRFPDESPTARASRASPPADTVQAITERVTILAEDAAKLISDAANTAETAAHAEDLADTLRDLASKAEELRKAEKKPHWDAGKAVDAKWSPVVEQATSTKERLFRLVVTPFKVRQKAENQAEAAREAAIVGNETTVAVKAVAAPVKGLYKVKTAEITDFKTCLLFFASHPKVQDLIQDLANAKARAGEELPPGCTLKVTEEAR